jgi:orotate phosphoribosyltransferase
MTAREELLELIDRECLTVGGDFQLSAGSGSNYYFDCKKATLDGRGLNLIAELMVEEIRRLPEKPAAIGGLTVGADPLIAGVIMRAPEMKGSIVRKEQKKHGTQSKVENQLPPGTTVVVVDDVVTSGKSTIAACDELQREGYRVVGVLAIVDRETGGMETLRERYGHAAALFRKSEFPKLRAAG